MLQIENEFLVVEVDQKGAQLTHVLNKQGEFDYIWNGTQWAKHAPLLFPAIGRSTQDSYLIDGKMYPMQQHGFASDYLFEIAEQSSNKLVLRLRDNEETFKSYPFHFELQVAFELVGQQLQHVFTVKNLDEQELSYSFGFHPAFNVPIDDDGIFEDYQILFETSDTVLEQFEIKKNPYPYRSGKKHVFNDGSKVLPLTRKIFESGLIILNNQIDQVILRSQKSAHQVKMELSDFPYFCLWTKEDENLDFICLEPFCGLPDVIDQTQEISRKEGNLHLAPKSEQVLRCTLTFE